MLAVCPCCEVDKHQLTPIQALVLGIGIRASLDDSKTIAEQMCSMHRFPIVQAMMAIAVKISNVKGLT